MFLVCQYFLVENWDKKSATSKQANLDLWLSDQAHLFFFFIFHTSRGRIISLKCYELSNDTIVMVFSLKTIIKKKKKFNEFHRSSV